MKRILRATIELGIVLGLMVQAPSAWAVYEGYINTLPSTATITSSNQDLQLELEAKVQQMVSAGHMAPTAFVGGLADYLPVSAAGRLFYDTPNETIYALSIAYPYLSSALKTSLKTYLNTELSSYSPVSVGYYGPNAGTLSQLSGTPREYFPQNTSLTYNFWPGISVHPSVLYSVWAYSYYTNDWNYATSNYASLLSLYNSLKSAGVKSYPDLAGVIGIARIAQHLGKTTDYNDALAFGETAFAAGVNFNQFLSNTQTAFPCVTVPCMGYSVPVFMFNHDPAALHFDRDLARFIQDQAASAATTYSAKLQNDIPLPWLTQGAITWGENSYTTPEVAWTYFMVRYSRGDSAAQLRTLLHKPDRKGDLLYIQELVTIIEASTPGAPADTLPPAAPRGARIR